MISVLDFLVSCNGRISQPFESGPLQFEPMHREKKRIDRGNPLTAPHALGISSFEAACRKRGEVGTVGRLFSSSIYIYIYIYIRPPCLALRQQGYGRVRLRNPPLGDKII